MFIVTARVPKKKLLAGCVTLLCCLAVVVTAVILSVGGRAVAASAEVRGVRDNDDRVAYLTQLGWTVSPEPIATEELLIPETFDDSYADYLALQEGQGFDLSKYCGKRVKRYTYEITNYPTGEAGIQAALLVYKNTIIGGEILSPSSGGFLHGLTMPASTAATPSASLSPSPSTSPSAGESLSPAPVESVTT